MNRRKVWLTGAVLALALQGRAGATQALGGGGREDAQFDVSPGQRLTVELKHGGGSIEVQGWDRDVVTVKTMGGSESDGVEINQDSSGVTVRARRERRWDHDDDDLRVVLQVPRRFDVKLQTVGGEVSISGVEGRFEGRTMGGDIKLTELKGSAELTTMGGDIEVTKSELDGRVNTMGGDVLLEDVRGNLRGSSMGGQVRERNVTRGDGNSSGEEARVRSMGGSIDIDRAPAGADLETMGGEITVRGAEKYVKAETMGGDVEIESKSGWVEASTMGGDMRVVLLGGASDADRHVDLTSMGGEIILEVPEDLSMDIEILLTTSKKDRDRHSIRSDFPVEQQTTEKPGRRPSQLRMETRATGKVGDGKHKIRIQTIAGDVILRKRSS